MPIQIVKRSIFFLFFLFSSIFCIQAQPDGTRLGRLPSIHSFKGKTNISEPFSLIPNTQKGVWRKWGIDFQSRFTNQDSIMRVSLGIIVRYKFWKDFTVGFGTGGNLNSSAFSKINLQKELIKPEIKTAYFEMSLGYQPKDWYLPFFEGLYRYKIGEGASSQHLGIQIGYVMKVFSKNTRISLYRDFWASDGVKQNWEMRLSLPLLGDVGHKQNSLKEAVSELFDQKRFQLYDQKKIVEKKLKNFQNMDVEALFSKGQDFLLQNNILTRLGLDSSTVIAWVRDFEDSVHHEEQHFIDAVEDSLNRIGFKHTWDTLQILNALRKAHTEDFYRSRLDSFYHYKLDHALGEQNKQHDKRYFLKRIKFRWNGGILLSDQIGVQAFPSWIYHNKKRTFNAQLGATGVYYFRNREEAKQWQYGISTLNTYKIWTMLNAEAQASYIYSNILDDWSFKVYTGLSGIFPIFSEHTLYIRAFYDFTFKKKTHSTQRNSPWIFSINWVY